jgi:hypothetical protein
VLVTVIHSHPNLTFEARLELTIGEAPNFSRKHQTRVKVADNDTHPSLLWNGVDYCGKKLCYKYRANVIELFIAISYDFS